MTHPGSFAELLSEAMKDMEMGAQRLAKATETVLPNARYAVPKSTIEGWLDGKIPQRWQHVLIVAAALGRNDWQADTLLKAAKKPTLEQLLQATSTNDDAYELVARWADVVTRRQEALGTNDVVDIDKIQERKTSGILSDRDLPSVRPRPKNGWLIGAALGVCIVAILGVTILRRPTSPGICGGKPQTIQIPSDISRQFGFTMYNTSNSYTTDNKGILGNAVRSVFVDEDGVWVGYGNSPDRNRGVSYVTDSLEDSKRNWETCSDAENKPIGQHINSITKDSGGDIWVATDGDGVWRLRNNKWQQYVFDPKAPTNGLPDPATYTVVYHGNTIFVGTLTGVSRYNNETWTKATDMAEREQVHAIAFTPNNDIWVGYVKKGVRHIRFDGSYQEYNTLNSLSNDNVRSIVVDNAGRAWIATWGGGINTFDNGQWTFHRAEQDALPSDNVNVLAKDRYGRIWAGTDKGVSYFDGVKWNIYSNLDTFSIGFGKSTRERCSFEDEHVWTGTNSSGLTHGRLPARSPVISNIRVTAIPSEVDPGKTFSPSVTITIEKGYNLAGGDFLHIADENSYTKHPFVAIPAGTFIDGGKSYTFTFKDENAITAPHEPGHYQSTWRLWQCGRYVGEPIKIEFIVR